MTRYQISRTPGAWSLTLLAVALSSGCSVLGAGSFDDYQRERADLVAQLNAEVGDARASSVSECQVVAVGAKACGGPTSYVVYSSTSSDFAVVYRLASAITALDRDANERFGLASTCEFIGPPEVVLDGQRCVASPGS